ncbi:hypothetical protein MRB56_20340 [Halomonas cupida]|uniref:tetratricopeptide repeat protein n=1 Tax=Halomonas cupida TaxID=44933 RepID=UPI0039B4B105
MSDDDRQAATLLHVMGHLYVKGGERKRGLILLLLAAHMQPMDSGILHTLVQAFIATGDTERALDAIVRLEYLQGPTPTQALLQSRALLAAGRTDDARASFRHYLQRREEG